MKHATKNGFALIESLVACLVLAIGLLGASALQTMALKGMNQTLEKNSAIWAVQSILEALRADKSNAAAGKYNITLTTSQCPKGQNLQDQQLELWCEQLASNLGTNTQTKGIISCDSSGMCQVSVQFKNIKVFTFDEPVAEVAAKTTL